MKTQLIIALSLLLPSVALAYDWENPSNNADRTESYSTRNYGTGEMSSSTITRHQDGSIDVRTFDYGSGNTTHYYGDETGGRSFNYGSGEMEESVIGNPYGAEEW